MSDPTAATPAETDATPETDVKTTVTETKTEVTTTPAPATAAPVAEVKTEASADDETPKKVEDKVTEVKTTTETKVTETKVPARETPVQNVQSGFNPLLLVLALLALLALTAGGAWWFSRPPVETPNVAETNPVPVEVPVAPVADTLPSGPITVAAFSDTRLAPVKIGRKDYLCAVLVFDQAVIEGVESDDLKWGTRSTKERWELCGTDLRKEDPDQHGARALTIGGRRVKLSELIAAPGGDNYVPLASTPGAIARCWGQGQVNGDGLPACTPQPAAPANVVAQNAAK